MKYFDMIKYFNSFICFDTNYNDEFGPIQMLRTGKYKVVSYKYKEEIKLSDYILLDDENNHKYLQLPLYRYCDAINNIYTDEYIKIELVVNNKRMQLNKKNYIFMQNTLNHQLYIRLTFENTQFDSFNFGYTGYIMNDDIRNNLIPVDNRIYISDKIKYYQTDNTISPVIITGVMID